MKEAFLKINNEVLSTLIAESSYDQQVGLMNRDYPIPNMSFVYSAPRINKFWMKNTKIPLDIIFCKSGKVVEICKGEPYSLSSIGGDHMSDLVVELPYGTASAKNIKVGTLIEVFRV